uniref:Uncharacterized protein n=1 Tax=Arundo donax TaxID=35708 RepID=A0A0A9EVB4_ARUDO
MLHLSPALSFLSQILEQRFLVDSFLLFLLQLVW